MNILKKLAFVFAALVVVCSIMIGIIISKFDSAAIHKQVVDHIASSIHLTMQVKGDVGLALLPRPHVIIKEVELFPVGDDYDLSLAVIPSINVYISLSSLILGNEIIDNVVLKNPVINIELSRKGEWNWKLKEGKSVDGSELTIQFGIINYYSQSSDFYKRFEQVNLVVRSESFEGPFFAEGSFNAMYGIYDRRYQVDAELNIVAKRKTNLVVNLGSDNFDLNYNGKLELTNTGIIESEGGVEITGNSFPNFFWNVMSREIHASDYDTNRFGTEDPFTIRALVSKDEKAVSVNDIDIKSETLVGKGSIKSFLADKVVTEAYLDIEYVGLDNLVESSQGWQMALDDIIVPEQSIVADIKIGELNYSTYSATGITIAMQSAARAMEVQVLNASLPGKGNINFEGSLYKLHWQPDSDMIDYDQGSIYQDAIPIIQGKFYSSGKDFRVLMEWFNIDSQSIKDGKLKDYSIQGMVRVAPYVMELDNIKFSVDNVFLEASSRISHSIGRTKILNKIVVETLNMKEYFTISQYVRNIDPLRFFLQFTQSDIDIYFESRIKELSMKSAKINDLFFVFSVNPAFIGLDRISMRSQNADFNGAILLDLRKEEPALKLDMYVKKIDIEALKKASAEISADDPKEKKEEEEEEEEVVTTTLAPSIWSQEPIRIGWLTRFDGNIDIRMESIKHKELEIKNLIFLAKVRDSVLKIDTFTAHMAEGALDVKGKLVGTASPTFGISFSLTKADINILLKTFLGYGTAEGTVSLVGSVGATGVSVARLVEQMYGNFSFAARGIDIQGMDAHHLIDNIFMVPEEVVPGLMARDLSTGKTQLYAADGLFTIKAGLLNIKKMVMSTSRMTGAMNGNFDLRTWVFAFLSKFSFIAYDPKLREDVTLSFGTKVSGGKKQSTVESNTKAIERYFRRRTERLDVQRR